jgi:putative hemolysin
VGELPDITADSAFEIVQRTDGSWLVDGDMSIAQFKLEVAIKTEFSGESNTDFHTLAGMILFHLQKLPHTGEICLVEGWKFKVIDMDGARIDKVLAIPLKSKI